MTNGYRIEPVPEEEQESIAIRLTEGARRHAMTQEQRDAEDEVFWDNEIGKLLEGDYDA